jgi:hypothetical protein
MVSSSTSMFLTQHTHNLYIYGDVYSALQKNVRTGQTQEALHWASEFVYSGNPNPLWNRLITILSEDIGIGGLPIIQTILDLHNNWQNRIKYNCNQIDIKHSYQSPIATASLIDAIRLMCAVPKNRQSCHVLCYVRLKWTLEQVLAQSPPQQESENNLDYLKRCAKYHLKQHQLELSMFLFDLLHQIETEQKINLDLISLMTELATDDIQPLVKAVTNLYHHKLGSPILTLAMLVNLICAPEQCNLKQFTSDLSVKDEWFYNDNSDITLRRRYAINNIHLDCHTSRGKGSKTYADNYHNLIKEGQKRNIDVNQWSESERQKSHGSYLTFASSYDENTEDPTPNQSHSQISQFWTLGAQVLPQYGQDQYWRPAYLLYLDLEKKSGYKACKSTKILSQRWPNIKSYLEIKHTNINIKNI